MADFNFTSGFMPPGVYTEAVDAPQLAVGSTVPTAVAIFGQAIGWRTYRESVIVPEDVTVNNTLVAASSEQLAKSGIRVPAKTPAAISATNVNIASPGATVGGTTMVAGDYVQLYGQTVAAQNGLYQWNTASSALTPIEDTLRVVNSITGEEYRNGKDYTIFRLNAGEDGLTDTSVTRRDDVYALKRVRASSSGIGVGQKLLVSYRYTEPEYFDVHSLYDYDDVRDRYGEPFGPNKQIQSELTLAAKFAFMNGASNVLTVAVDPYSVNANGTQKELEECYFDALDKLSDESQIAIVVPAIGDDYVHDLIKTHVAQQSDNRYERRAILGIDGTKDGGKVPTSSRIQLARSMKSNRIAMVSPSQFQCYSVEVGDFITLGGQFMAAAVAGKSVSQIAAMPLTRKTITGFVGPTTTDSLREGEKTNETANGLMVIEKTRSNQLQIRHGVTTDPADLLNREWSITGQQDVMVYRVRDYLDADGLIGMPIYDTTLIQVKASAESALVSLVRDQVIVGYQNLKVRQIATMPDVIEVRYEWKPAYPLNYILVKYSVAVMTGDVVVTEATA
jgi:hypothetical protein